MAFAAPLSETLVERESELATLAEAVAEGAERGRLVVVEGSAGIGKTRLLDEAARLARRATVLRARAAELEAGYAWGLARQIFEPALRRAGPGEREALLAESGGRCGWLVAPPGEGDDATEQPRLHGLYWLTAALAARGPVVLLVDDAQWGDTPSLHFLDHLARRFDDMPVTVVASLRPAPRAAAVDALVQAPGAVRLAPQPLTDDGVARLLATVLGAPEPPFAEECRRATGGVPFLVLELGRALAADGVAPTGAAAERVRGIGPAAVARAALVRITGLDPLAVPVARALTVLGDGAGLDDLAAFAGVAPAELDAALDALVAAELVARDQPLRFTHPLVRDALHEDLGPAGSAAEHARAALLLLERDAPPSQVAAHLLLSPRGRVPGAAAALAAAAHDALAGGAPDLAAACLRRCREEDPDAGFDLLLGDALVAAGDVAGALEVLEPASAGGKDAAARALAGLALGRARFTAGDPEGALRAFVAAQEEVGEGDLWLELEAERLNALRADTSSPPPESPWLWENLPRLRGGTRGERALLAYASHELMRVGRPREAVAAARLTLADGRYLADVGSDSYRFHEVPHVFTWGGEVDEARRHFTDALADARRRGSPFGFAVSLLGRSMASLRSGAAHEAEADGRAALAVLEEHGWDAIVPLFSGFVSDVLLERDLIDEAADLLRRHGMDGELPQIDVFALTLDSRSRLRAAQGRWTDALDDALACGTRFESMGSINPVLPWRTTAALALAALGRDEEGRTEAAREQERADRHGSSRAQGIARRTAALVAEGDPDPSALREAATLIAKGADRLEEARTHVALGRALRLAGDPDAARETVLAAADTAHELGAALVLREAATELRALNARPRRFARTGVEALSASERRTADLAAGGMTNREIAQELFLSVKTVETHLRNAFRKLDVRSRAELADRLR